MSNTVSLIEPVSASLDTPRIEPVGDRCLMVRFGDEIRPDIGLAVRGLAASLLEVPIIGVIDVAPAFTALAVHYLPEVVAPDGSSAFARLREQLRERLVGGIELVEAPSRTIDVPVCYGGEYGPDLEAVAQRCAMSTGDVIRLHGAEPLTVQAFFFSPGNPFAGPLDPRLSVPRRQTPRERVEAGSIGLANGLTSIYQITSPGGWNIIGRTPWSLFDLSSKHLTRFNVGDRLRFVPISPDAFIEQDEH